MLKTLAKSIRQYKLVSLLTPLFIAIEVVMETFIVFTVRNLLNLLQRPEGFELGDVYKSAGILAILAFVSLFCGRWKRRT